MENSKFITRLTEKQIQDVIGEDDLNTAMYDAQSELGIETGDVCGLYWSGYDGDEEWENSNEEERLAHLKAYLELEDLYAEDD